MTRIDIRLGKVGDTKLVTGFLVSPFGQVRMIVRFDGVLQVKGALSLSVWEEEGETGSVARRSGRDEGRCTSGRLESS